MVPEGAQVSNATCGNDEVLMAGYKECATEALNWLLGLGYEPGHPLIRSLAAHLTKKQAYLEKMNLERFLVEETLKNTEIESLEEDEEIDFEFSDSDFEMCALQIQNNPQIQKALVEAVYKGCDLQYKNDTP